MKEDAMQILLTARIGDGYVYKGKTCNNAYSVFSSVLQDYMLYKHKVLTQMCRCSGVKQWKYRNNSNIYAVRTSVSPICTELLQMSKCDIIDRLDYYGYLIYYLDDGCYDKSYHSMRLSCCSFTDDEITHLVNKVCELFSIKKCHKHIYKGRNCKEYPYLYVPAATTRAIVEYYKSFMLSEPLLHCMLYKLGLPSQTIEKQSLQAEPSRVG